MHIHTHTQTYRHTHTHTHTQAEHQGALAEEEAAIYTAKGKHLRLVEPGSVTPR
jgi:hypothetical protein